MKFFSSKRLFSGFTAVVFLAGILSSPTAVYAGSEDPEPPKFKTKPAAAAMPAGVYSEDLEKRSSGLLSTSAVLVKRGNRFYSQKNYAEALGFYARAAGKGSEEGKQGLLKIGTAYLENAQVAEAVGCYQKAVEKGVNSAQEKFEEALTQLISRGDDLCAEEKVEEAMMRWYTQAVGYGSVEAKERISTFGVKDGDAHVGKNNQEEALKCYEQASLYGSEEAKKKLEKLKQASVVPKQDANPEPKEPNKQPKPQPAAPIPLDLMKQGDVFFNAGNLAEALKDYEAALGGNAAAQGKLKSTVERMLQGLSREGENPHAQILALFEPEGRAQAELDLSRSNIDAAGAVALASVLSQTKVTTLNLKSNNIGAAGAQALSKNTTLKTLDLGKNKIGNAGAVALLKNTTLMKLNLSRHGIGAAGAKGW